MFLERFKEVENFTITKLPLGGSKTIILHKVEESERKISLTTADTYENAV